MRRWPLPAFALILCVALLSGSFLVFGQARQKPESALAQLLSGSSSDLSGTLSALPETNLPLALAVAEALRFKALHGDGAFSSDEVAAFRQAVINRLAQAKTVSLEKSETCFVSVPAKEITLSGVRIDVPAHFTMSGDLCILETSPIGEAGSLLPDFLVSFHAGFPPVAAKLSVDGKAFAEGSTRETTLLFRPAADLSLEDPPFAAELAFNQKGAATILATVTLRIRPMDGWKPSNKEPSDPTPKHGFLPFQPSEPMFGRFQNHRTWRSKMAFFPKKLWEMPIEALN